MIITLSRDKSNQEGDEKKTVDRHVYANPKDPLSDMLFFLGLRILSEFGAHKSNYICGDEAQEGIKNNSRSKDGAFGTLLRNVLGVTNIQYCDFFTYTFICLII